MGGNSSSTQQVPLLGVLVGGGCGLRVLGGLRPLDLSRLGHGLGCRPVNGRASELQVGLVHDLRSDHRLEGVDGHVDHLELRGLGGEVVDLVGRRDAELHHALVHIHAEALLRLRHCPSRHVGDGCWRPGRPTINPQVNSPDGCRLQGALGWDVGEPAHEVQGHGLGELVCVEAVR
eukprot:2547094-Alexandrium_andersonii.AAC.1